MAPSTRKSAAATSNKGKARAIAAEADEYTEVTGGGDFPQTWSFEEQGDLVGRFVGTEVKAIKGKDRTIHTFEVDGEPVTAWGTAILDSRLSDVQAGEDLKVIKTGAKLATKSGRSAWEFKVYIRKSALNKR